MPEQRGDFLRPPPVSSDQILRGTSTAADPAAPSQNVVAFQLLERVGEGGMGVVYRAMQDHPSRIVALKIIKNAARQSDIRRFQREIDILARLQHPGISRLYSVGEVQTTLSTHAPYMAMEFVDGLPIAEYARVHDLGIHDKLRLMIRVCEAVAFAHEHRVIHRDLKPSNILVDRHAMPRILDFGLAAFTGDSAGSSSLTEDGQLLGTLDYMSPEQAQGGAADLDERTDVYALGVILFELLTGRRPYDLSARSIIDAVETIKTGTITRLSAVDRALRGDLETIVAKALAKDRTQRYVGVGALAEDLRCVLTNEPIRARRPTVVYRSRKFIQRNRAFLAVVSLIIALLIAGLAISLRAERRAESAQRDAQRALAYAMLSDADSRMQHGQFTEARKAINEAWDLLESLHESTRAATIEMVSLDLISPTPLRDLESKAQSIGNVAISAQGNIALAFHDDRVEVHDPATDKVLFATSLKNAFALKFSPDGRLLFAIGEIDTVLKVWDWAAGREIYSFKGKDLNSVSLAAGNDRLAYVSGTKQLNFVVLPGERNHVALPFSGTLSTAIKGDTVLVVDRDHKLWEFSFDGTHTPARPLALTGNPICLSPDGNLIADMDHGANVYRLPDMQLVATINPLRNLNFLQFVSPSMVSMTNFGERTLDLASSDGRQMQRLPYSSTSAKSNGTLSVSIANERQALWASIPNLYRVLLPGPDSQRSVRISGDGRIVAVTLKGGRLVVLEAATGRRIFDAAVADDTYVLGCSRDGTKVITKSPKGRIQVWDVATGKPGPEYTETKSTNEIAMSSAADTLYWCNLDSGATRLDVTPGGVRESAMDVPFQVNSLSLSQDDRRIAFAGNKEAQIWDTAKGQCISRIPFSEPMTRCALVRRGDYLVCTGQLGKFSVWKTDTGAAVPSDAWPTSKFDWCTAGDRILYEDSDAHMLTEFAVEDPGHPAHLRLPPPRQLESFQCTDDGNTLAGISSPDGVAMLDLSLPERLRVIDRRGGPTAGGDWLDAAGVPH